MNSNISKKNFTNLVDEKFVQPPDGRLVEQ